MKSFHLDQIKEDRYLVIKENGAIKRFILDQSLSCFDDELHRLILDDRIIEFSQIQYFRFKHKVESQLTRFAQLSDDNFKENIQKLESCL